MKLPLLLDYKPCLGTGPTVMLAQGTWRFESNHKDTKLGIALNLAELFNHDIAQELMLTVATMAKVVFTEVGSESGITIYAIRQE